MTVKDGKPQSGNGAVSEIDRLALIRLHLDGVEQKACALFDTLAAFRKAFPASENPVLRHFETSIYDQLIDLSDGTKDATRLIARLDEGGSK